MYRSTINITAPVITILSPSRVISLQVIESLRQNVTRLCDSDCGDDGGATTGISNKRIVENNTATSTDTSTKGNYHGKIIQKNESNEEIKYTLLQTMKSSARTTPVDDTNSDTDTDSSNNIIVDTLDTELNNWCGLKNNNNTLPKHTWESVAVEINTNGPVLHFLSPSVITSHHNNNNNNNNSTTPFLPFIGSTILSIHGDYNSIDDTRTRIAHYLRTISDLDNKNNTSAKSSTTTSLNPFRSLSSIEPFMSQLKWNIQYLLGVLPHSTTALRTLIQSTELFTPILDVRRTDTGTASVSENKDDNVRVPNWKYGDLKEIVIPTFLKESTCTSTNSSEYENITNNFFNRLSVLATTTSNELNNNYYTSTSMQQHQQEHSNTGTSTGTSTSSCIHRVVPGLYQLNDGSNLCIRPIPVAEHDQHLSAPTLIFHTPNLEEFEKNLQKSQQQNQQSQQQNQQKQQQDDNNNNNNNTKRKLSFSKIGYNGQGIGQILIQSESNNIGFDIRYCSRTIPASMFCETQTSLLAGTISSLQSDYIQKDNGTTSDQSSSTSSSCAVTSVNKRSGIIVTKHSSTTNTSTQEQEQVPVPVSSVDDDRHCWTEFRESLRYPQRYWDSTKIHNKQKQRIAPSQNLPYE